MVGSVAEGEDVVQDTLARAWFALGEMEQGPPLRPWLFRIAHDRAIDRWRYERARASEPLDPETELPGEAWLDPEDAIARQQTMRAAIGCFLALPPAQRAGDPEGRAGLVAGGDRRRARPLRAGGEVGAAPRPRRLAPAASRPGRGTTPTSRGRPQPRSALRQPVQCPRLGRRPHHARRGRPARPGVAAQGEPAAARSAPTSQLRRIAGWRLPPGWLDGSRGAGGATAAGVPPPYFVELGWRIARWSRSPPLRALHRPGQRVRALRRGLTLRPRRCPRRAGSRSARRRVRAEHPAEVRHARKPKPVAISVIERRLCAVGAALAQASSRRAQDVAGDASASSANAL